MEPLSSPQPYWGQLPETLIVRENQSLQGSSCMNAIVARVPELAAALSHPTVQKFVVPLLEPLSRVVSMISDQEAQEFALALNNKVKDLLGKAGVDSFAALVAKQERITPLEEEALKLFISNKDSVLLLKESDFALLRATYGANSDQEDIVTQYWNEVCEICDGYASYKRVQEYLLGLGEEFSLSLKSLMSEMKEESFFAGYKKITQALEELEKKSYGELQRKGESIEQQYAVIQFQLIIPPLIKHLKRPYLERTISHLKEEIESDRVFSEKYFVGRIDGYQQKITSIVQSLSSKLAEKLVLFEERIAKLQKEGCQKDLEPWQRARDAIIQTQRFLSNPECIESPGITFAFFLENLGLEETVEIGTKLLDESLLLESLSTEKECLLISQSNFHNLEEDLLKQHGNPKDLEALLPVESECDRAIVETFNKAREESLPKEEDLSVQYFLAKLESDAKSKIEKFSQIAARVVPL